MSYAVRNTKRRQYFNERTPRDGRWGRCEDATLYVRESDALRQAFTFNREAGRTIAEVVVFTATK